MSSLIVSEDVFRDQTGGLTPPWCCGYYFVPFEAVSQIIPMFFGNAKRNYIIRKL